MFSKDIYHYDLAIGINEKNLQPKFELYIFFSALMYFFHLPSVYYWIL